MGTTTDITLSRALKRGDHVIANILGEEESAVVVKIRKSDGAVFIRLDKDGAEGTVAASGLKKIKS